MTNRSFFAPPIFKRDEEKTIEAITLNAALWTVVALLVFSQIGNFIGGKTPPLVIILNFIFIAICLGARYTLHKGWLKETSIIMLILGSVHITITTGLIGTIHTPAAANAILVVIIAGFQFGNKGVIISTASMALVFYALIFAEHNQLLPIPDYNVGITQWVAYMALFGLTGNLIVIATKIIHRSLQRSHLENNRRKRAEERLRIFSRAIKQNPASVMIVNRHGIIEEVNPKFQDFSGYTREEAIGANPRIQKSGFHTQAFYENLWKTILAGKEWEGVLKNKRKNGELYWEKTLISPVFNEKKEITHFVAVKEDITEQREAQQKQAATNRQLKEKIKQINSLQETLKKQALRDPLTGLYNRRYMDEILKTEFARAKRGEYPVSIIFLDMDHLKDFNDLGGHATGDKALQNLAAQLKAFIRQEDAVCRYGGDEFAVILPQTTGEEAFRRTQELINRMQELAIVYRDDQFLQITFTAGIAAYPAHGQTIEEIFNYADVALYRAKLKGRNRVELFEQE